MKGDRRWKDETLTSKEQRRHQRKEDNQTGRKEKKLQRKHTSHIPGSSLFTTTFFLLYADAFHFIKSDSGPLKPSQRQDKEKDQKKWSWGEWRLHHGDSLQTSVTYNLPWQSHINTQLCWQGTALKQTKLPFETVTRMYRQKPLFSQEGWTFSSVSECLNRLFDSLSVWYLGLMWERKLY